MNDDAIRGAIRRALGAITPESDLGALDPRASLRATLDLDSMDFLRFVTALHDDLGVDVPEADYRRLDSLDGCAAYLAAHLPPP